ncbi:cation:dicarboxylate symporter family transporter [Spiroplasma endosymbiont of 'Nebria riversi']|uniref:cation:dicarboxylate symporter family transporter n=1 Tax=Spiroplasma endosymbiont of 'Nebria riversi' TaxID=2792084 RepID=UPI001C04108B|nr:cation:dicarboxylase symporter family transporter [Spiroplasma endosymbiont of 'Nebria riversi']
MRFSFRIFTAIGGVIFAIGIQAILGFPNDDSTTSIWKEVLEDKKKTENPNYNLLLHQVITWIILLKTIFINGMLMLSVPVVFLAIARVVAKPHTSGLATMTIKGIIILLINVAVAYKATYLVGMVLDIGSGLNLQPEGMRDETTVKELPEVISNYMPANFIGAFVGGAIILVMVIVALVGYAIKKQSKRYEREMNTSRDTLERFWKIVMSMLMTFMKFMPYAVMSMVIIAIIGGPIAHLVDIGKVMGTAYIGLFISLVWHTLTILIFGIKSITVMEICLKTGYSRIYNAIISSNNSHINQMP